MLNHKRSTTPAPVEINFKSPSKTSSEARILPNARVAHSQLESSTTRGAMKSIEPLHRKWKHDLYIFIVKQLDEWIYE